MERERTRGESARAEALSSANRLGLTVVYRLKAAKAGRSSAALGVGAALINERKAERVYPRPARATSQAASEAWALRARSEDEARTVLEALQQDPLVERSYVAPPRYLASRRNQHAAGSRGSTLNLAWRAQVKLAQAQSLLQWNGTHRIPVAILDSGVDVSHPALTHVAYAEHITESPPALPDPTGHGTHVTGLIASLVQGGWSSEGVAAPIADVTVHRGLADPYDPLAYYRALRAATGNARVINLSLSGSADDPEETDEIEHAIARGVVVVAAMGNEAEFGEVDAFPASIGGVIAVGAVDDAGKRAPFSNCGGNICVAAPGVDVGSTVPMYAVPLISSVTIPPGANMSGTSMACPIVTGIVVRMLSYNPGLSPKDIRNSLRGDPCGNTFDEVGIGVVDAAATLSQL